MFVKTTATTKLAALTKRIRGIAGGTSASKTVSILLILIDYAQTHNSELISVVSESFPHLKKGAMRDFKNIMVGHQYWDDNRWNATDYIYTFETGTKMEFFSADQPGKVRGPRRDILFINEANNVPYETYDQLEVRTSKVIWLDWNPTSEFWFYSELKDKPNVDFIILTYKDNEALAPSIIESIESKRGNKRWWKVYGEGQLGDSDAKIYKDWQIIDSIPHEARLERYGLDFGYTNDPTVVVAVYSYNGGYILDEILYRRGLLHNQIADLLKLEPFALIIADSASPMSIAELQSYGLSVRPADKGRDSVNTGISIVQSQRVSVTKRSLNTIKEYRNFMYIEDKDGKITNEPSPIDNHAMDAIRYAIVSLTAPTTSVNFRELEQHQIDSDVWTI